MAKSLNGAWVRKVAKLIEEGHPNPWKEVSKHYTVDIREMHRYYQLLKNLGKLEAEGKLKVEQVDA